MIQCIVQNKRKSLNMNWAISLRQPEMYPFKFPALDTPEEIWVYDTNLNADGDSY